MTAHSPVGIHPEKFGVKKKPKLLAPSPITTSIILTTGIDHNKFSFGLKKSLFNFMHGICFDYELQEWFEFKIPKTKISGEYLQRLGSRMISI
jgi:hypothetical protein